MTDKQTEKVQHTPGPWSVRRASMSDMLCVVSGLPGANEQNIVYVHTTRSEMEQRPNETVHRKFPIPSAEPNARLIAASPRMLAALKRLVTERDDDPERYPLEPTCNECTEGLTPLAHDKGLCHWHEARAAIAAAEGRDNG